MEFIIASCCDNEHRSVKNEVVPLLVICGNSVITEQLKHYIKVMALQVIIIDDIESNKLFKTELPALCIDLNLNGFDVVDKPKPIKRYDVHQYNKHLCNRHVFKSKRFNRKANKRITCNH